MILNLRGTNGCGKSYVVRRIIEEYEIVQEVLYPPDMRKRRPQGYICQQGARRLFVPGHYEPNVNGGVDTLPGLPYAYDLITSHHGQGADVIFEGKNYTENLDFIKKMDARGVDVRVIFIDLPLGNCLAAVKQRGSNIKPETVTNLYNKSVREHRELSMHMATALKLSRADALRTARKWLLEDPHYIP